MTLKENIGAFAKKMRDLDNAMIAEIKSDYIEKEAFHSLNSLLDLKSKPLCKKDHSVICQAISSLKTKELYEKYGVSYILKQLEDEHEKGIVSVGMQFPAGKFLTDNMAADLINAVKNPWQIKAINAALSGVPKSFCEEFQATLSKNTSDTLLWFHCLAIVATAPEKYQLNLSKFEQNFVIPAQIRIAQRTVACMIGGAQKTQGD